jgi:hypothetical protein
MQERAHYQYQDKYSLPGLVVKDRSSGPASGKAAGQGRLYAERLPVPAGLLFWKELIGPYIIKVSTLSVANQIP